MNIYEKIFARLEELHMSQIELSRRTGIATSTISDWRKKKINPQADKLVAICKALDISLVDLLCDEEDKKNTTLTADYKAFSENHKDKHNSKAKYGWYRYDTRFAIPKYDNDGELEGYNIFKGRLVIRHARDGKLYLYDILRIKKETSEPLE